MSATSNPRRVKATRYPTITEYDTVAKALHAAHDEVERLRWRIGDLTEAWLDAGEIPERPTFETIGIMADFIDTMQMAIDELSGHRDKLTQDLHEVMLIRGDLAVRARA